MRRLKRSLIFLTVTVMLCGSLLSFATAYANEAVNETEPLISEPITDVPAVASVGASEIESGKVYRIKNANSGLYLALPGNDADLSNINLAVKDNSALNQQFKIVYDETYGFYRIHTMMSSFGTNRVLDIFSNPNSPPTNGRNVHIYVIEIIENFNSYGWQISDVGNDKVKICADYNESLALTAAAGGTAAGTNVLVNTYSGAEHQKWILEEVVSNAGTNANVSSLVDGGIYRIKDFSGNYLTVAPNTAGNFDVTLNNVEMRPAVAHLCQEFKVELNPDGSYYIRAMVSSNGTNRLIDVYSSNIDQIVNGANVHLHHPGDENSSRWKIEYLSVVQAFTIKIACKTNLGMAVSGTNVQMASFHGGMSQLWFFEPVPSTVVITTSASSFYREGRYQFYATVYPAGVSQEVTWTSVFPNVATVDEYGEMTVVGNGYGIISARSEITGQTGTFVFFVTNPTVESREGIYYVKIDGTYLTAGNRGEPIVEQIDDAIIITVPTTAIGFNLKTRSYDDEGNEIEDEKFLWSFRKMSDGNYTIASMGTRYYGASNNWGIDDYVLTVNYENNLIYLEPYSGKASQIWVLSESPADDAAIEVSSILDCFADFYIEDSWYSFDDIILDKYEADDYYSGWFESGTGYVESTKELNVVLLVEDEIIGSILGQTTGWTNTNRTFFQSICDELNNIFPDNVNFSLYSGDYFGIIDSTFAYIGDEDISNKYHIYIEPSLIGENEETEKMGKTEIFSLNNYTDINDNNSNYGAAVVNLFYNSNNQFDTKSLNERKTIIIHEILHAVKLKHPNVKVESAYEYNETEEDYAFLPSSIMLTDFSINAARITDFDYENIITKYSN